MHEQTKINEAKYFLAQMTALVDDRAAFNFNLSAFLAAARSALQYAHNEANRNPAAKLGMTARLTENPSLNSSKTNAMSVST